MGKQGERMGKGERWAGDDWVAGGTSARVWGHQRWVGQVGHARQWAGGEGALR
jgi:hypothetical protein